MTHAPSARERSPRIWVLNLDAEHELERPRGYQRSLHLRRIVERESERLRDTLVQPGDLVLGEDAPSAFEAALEALRGSGVPLLGQAWSPTPSALARLEAAGVRTPPAPSLEVLRRVNARPFTVPLRAPLAQDAFAKRVVGTLDEVQLALDAPARLGWLVRRTFGAAGRGRRRIASGAPLAADRDWLVASLRLGPLVVEPWVEVETEYTRSGFVDANGRVSISAPCIQATTRTGAWSGTERAGRAEVARSDDERVAEAALETGAALAGAGYFGPFGIDAYRYRDPERSGISRLNPLSEVNARWTMDWATAPQASPGLLHGLLADG